MSKSRSASSLSTGSDLVDEIKAMRQSYLHRGGSEMNILSQFTELEKEAECLLRNEMTVDYDDFQNLNQLNEDPYRRSQIGIYNDDSDGQLLHVKSNCVEKLEDLERRLNSAERRIKVEKVKKRFLDSRENQKELSHDSQESVNDLRNMVLKWITTSEDNSLSYDPNVGFVILYDHVVGLPLDTVSVQLSVALYTVRKSTGQYGQPVILDPVHALTIQDSQTTKMAFIGAKQPVTGCQPNNVKAKTYIIIELITSDPTSKPVTRAWCRVELFNGGQLRSGQWRISFLALPIQPLADPASLTNFGQSEICIRFSHPSSVSNAPILVPVTETSLLTYKQDKWTTESINEGYKSDFKSLLLYDDLMTFQVDRIKGAEPMQCKVQLTAYHRQTGQIVKSKSGSVTCTTTSVDSRYRNIYHVFGQQEVSFDGVRFDGDEILIARVYLASKNDAGYWRRQSQNDPQIEKSVPSRLDDDDDDDVTNDNILVAWSSLSLVRTKKIKGSYSLNAGTHMLRLFLPPVSDLGIIGVGSIIDRKKPYLKATLRLKITPENPRPGSITPSEESEDDLSNSQGSWLLREQTFQPIDPFTTTDGFDLYIDGCRFLPDKVSVTRISASVLDKHYTKVGRAMNCVAKLDSNIYEPTYGYRIEFREPALPPTSTLLIKIYTSDREFKSSVILGYSLLNVFVQTGSLKQPLVDAGMQVSINEGAHQLSVYDEGPDGSELLTSSCISHKRLVPCATVLVRLVKSILGPKGKPLEADRVPRVDWEKFGLIRPMPKYSDHVYFSEKCRPKSSERLLFDSMLRRRCVTVKELVFNHLSQPKDLKKYKTDAELDNFLWKRFSEIMDKPALNYDLTFISRYVPRYGFKIAIDEAINIPWPNFTEALICINPPAAFYKDAFETNDITTRVYDKPFFTKRLDLSSTNREPVWDDGFFHFRHRSYHKFLTVLIQLKEIEVLITPVGYKYSLRDEAWTAVQIFNDEYVYTSHYQLPLIQGSPSTEDLHRFEAESFKDLFKRGAHYDKVQLIPEASVMIRLCDGRRDDELPTSSPDATKLKLDMSYLPPDTRTSYKRRGGGRTLTTLVPDGKNPKEFSDALAGRFKRLVYRLHMEEND